VLAAIFKAIADGGGQCCATLAMLAQDANTSRTTARNALGRRKCNYVGRILISGKLRVQHERLHLMHPYHELIDAARRGVARPALWLPANSSGYYRPRRYRVHRGIYTKFGVTSATAYRCSVSLR
jgi:hypothetical protein